MFTDTINNVLKGSGKSAFCRPENQVYLLKSSSELEKMKDEDENVTNEDLISKYIKRPSELENLSLAEFAADYTYQNSGKKYEAKSKLGPDGFLLETNYNNDETDELPGINNENLNTVKKLLKSTTRGRFPELLEHVILTKILIKKTTTERR